MSGRRRVHVRGHARGHAAGPGGEIPATGRRLLGRGIEAIHVLDGKIVDDHLYFDQVQVLTQLGLMPEAATA